MESLQALKALSDETRLHIIKLLLKHRYCVRALSKMLGLTEPTISQHLKVLREAGLIAGEKRGYYMHYDVKRCALRRLSAQIEELAEITREACPPSSSDCHGDVVAHCHDKEARRHGNCQCHKPKETLR